MRARIRLPARILTALAACLLCMPVALRAQEPAWWDNAWQYRLVVGVPPVARRAGVNTAELNMAEQGRLCRDKGADVRVIDARGRPVACRTVVPDSGAGHLLVRFQLADDADTYHVYYGNPKAAAAAHQWEEKMGGLTLETREMTPGDGCNDPGMIPAKIAQYPQATGKREWGQIQDLENPFGRNDFYISIYRGVLHCPLSGYYRFALNADDVASFHIEDLNVPLCIRRAGVPSESWERSFAGAGGGKALEEGVYPISYYHVENGGAQLASLGWKLPGEQDWETVPPEAFVKYVPVEMLGREERGAALNAFFVYRHLFDLIVSPAGLRCSGHRFEARCDDVDGLQFEWDFGDGTKGTGQAVEHEFPDTEPYQVKLVVKDPQGHSAQLVRPVTQRGRAVRRMTVEMQVESKAAMLAPGQDADIEVYVRTSGPVSRGMAMERASRTPPQEAQTPAQNGSVRKLEFVALGAWLGSLSDYLGRVRSDEQQTPGALTMGHLRFTVLHPTHWAKMLNQHGAASATVVLEVDGESFVSAGVSLNGLLRYAASVAGEPAGVPMALEADGITYAGLDKWVSVHKEQVPPGNSVRSAFRLLLHGRAVEEKMVSVLSTNSALGGLTLDASHALRDADGGLVVLRLADVRRGPAPGHSPVATRALCDRTGLVRTLVLDEALAGPAGAREQTDYTAFLRRALDRSYKDLRFRFDRPDISIDHEAAPVRRFVEMHRRMLTKPQPNIVILVCQPESVLNAVPPVEFETYMVAMVDQILSQTRAEPILVAPPPMPARPELSRAYARIAKKTGLRKGVLVVDLYSRFMLTPNWRDLFLAQMATPAAARQPSFMLYPNEEGQKLIGREIFTSIVARMHRDLSQASQAASYARQRQGANADRRR